MSEPSTRPAVAALEQAYQATLEAYIEAGTRYLAVRGIPGNEWIQPWLGEISRSISRIPTEYQLPWNHPARRELGEAYGAAYQEHMDAWHALSTYREEEDIHE